MLNLSSVSTSNTDDVLSSPFPSSAPAIWNSFVIESFTDTTLQYGGKYVKWV